MFSTLLSTHLSSATSIYITIFGSIMSHCLPASGVYYGERIQEWGKVPAVPHCPDFPHCLILLLTHVATHHNVDTACFSLGCVTTHTKSWAKPKWHFDPVHQIATPLTQIWPSLH